MWEEIFIILTAINVGLAIFNTWLAWERTCYNRDVLYGSIKYWGSWKERSQDIVEKTLQSLSVEDLEKEIERKTNKSLHELE